MPGNNKLNVETRSWLRCQTVTFFGGETIREALHKMFTWVHYMDFREYNVECISLSWADNQLLVVYKLKDRTK